ncbi:MAG: 3-deoxy-D-manno-octulosonic-acid transferase [Candidatus Sumerlaeota bacterium]|nr:3-deoxy-D-manno-octulosonic-acid transferase [Candidatus Sumerlaeota bacterium]
MNLYDAAYLAALPVMAPAIAYKRLRHGKYRDSLPGMLGRRLPAPPLAAPGTQRCWLHSVSVGETVAAGAVYREFGRRELGWEFLCTTTTETGQAQARSTFEGTGHFAFAPADFSWIVRRFHQAYNPSLYLFFETEIWPNNLIHCGRHGLPVFMVNGKLSDRSSRRYARAGSIIREPLSHVRRFFMQTQRDAERLERIIRDPARIEVTGNVKFDALPAPLTPEERAGFRRLWGAADDAVVILAGSTHPGEEELIWKAYEETRAAHPNALLVVAPRHPERFDAVAADFAKRGARVHRTSTGDNPAPGETDVVLIDQMRVLARSFGAAEIALVAGSWSPTVGGHNLLEAGVHGIPVLRGPHMHSQPDIVRVLGPKQGAPEVAGEQLAEVLTRLCGDPGERARLGGKAAAASASNRGAAVRVVDRVLELLK